MVAIKGVAMSRTKLSTQSRIKIQTSNPRMVNDSRTTVTTTVEAVLVS